MSWESDRLLEDLKQGGARGELTARRAVLLDLVNQFLAEYKKLEAERDRARAALQSKYAMEALERGGK